MARIDFLIATFSCAERGELPSSALLLSIHFWQNCCQEWTTHSLKRGIACNQFVLNNANSFCFSSETTDDQFLFVHHNEWQRLMLLKYGQEICPLTQRTILPNMKYYAFFVCVSTKYGYMNVGIFMVEWEWIHWRSIADSLLLYQGWKPKHFWIDIDEQYITATENVFPGTSLYLINFSLTFDFYLFHFGKQSFHQHIWGWCWDWWRW